jgi:hypothetical protein
MRIKWLRTYLPAVWCRNIVIINLCYLNHTTSKSFPVEDNNTNDFIFTHETWTYRIYQSSVQE